MNAFERAKLAFPIGAKVEARTTRPEWSPDIHADRVVCGHERFRDSDDDPVICVTLVSVAGAVTGWFKPEDLTLVEPPEGSKLRVRVQHWWPTLGVGAPPKGEREVTSGDLRDLAERYSVMLREVDGTVYLALDTKQGRFHQR